MSTEDLETIHSLVARSPRLSELSESDLAETIRPDDMPTVIVDSASREDVTEAPTLHPAAGESAPLAIVESGFELLDVLGRGGMGVVFRARQRDLHRDVAIKQVAADRATDLATRKAFLAESVVTGHLEHPNIVPIYGMRQEASGELWLVMKRISGRTLTEVLAEDPPPHDGESLVRYVELLIDVCHALSFSHSRNILHRDIKPDNIMLGDYGEVLLVDWGIAVVFGQDRELDADLAALTPKTTGQNQICGTPRYMAPEMAEARGGDLGPWTDVYLLGAVLYQVLAGHPPHQGDSLVAVLEAARRSEPQALDESVPPELAIICKKALAREPRDRYQTVAALRGDLRDFLDHRESRALARQAQEDLERWRQAYAKGIDATNRASLYARISEITSAFGHATLLWPGNADAAEGETVARRLHADAALEAGDLGLAEAALGDMQDEESIQLRDRIEDSLRGRRRTLALARFIGAGLVAVQALLAGALGLYIYVNLRQFTLEEILEELRRVNRPIAELLRTADSFDSKVLDPILDRVSRDGLLRCTLIGLDGVVLADSEGSPELLENHASRPEVQAALSGVEGTAVRLSATTGDELIYFAEPWSDRKGEVRGVLRSALPRSVLANSLRPIAITILTGLVLSFLVSCVVILRLSRHLRASIARMV